MINYSIAIRSAQPGKKKNEITETKAYPVYQASETLTAEDLAEHISSHGSKYDEGDIAAILHLAVRCIRELLLEGKIVQLGKLGSFAPSLKVEGSASASTVSAENIKKVKVNFRPGKKFAEMRADAEFQCVPSREAQALAVAEARAQETIQPDGDEDENELG